MVLLVLSAYLLLVLGVGLFGHRLFRGTGEDYFLASRSIGPFVLLMTLLGTNMTAFTLLGASGEAYRRGVIVFALMGSSTAIIVPFLFYYLGIRSWKLGKRHGYVTQVQLVRDRYGSDSLGALLFVVSVALMLPYLLIGVKGGGDALNVLTGGPGVGLRPWVGSLAVCAVTYVYVSYGGMRSTAWVNALQTTVFLLFGVAAYAAVMMQFGGIEAAMTRLRAEQPGMASFGTDRFAILQMGLVPATSAMHGSVPSPLQPLALRPKRPIFPARDRGIPRSRSRDLVSQRDTGGGGPPAVRTTSRRTDIGQAHRGKHRRDFGRVLGCRRVRCDHVLAGLADSRPRRDVHAGHRAALRISWQVAGRAPGLVRACVCVGVSRPCVSLFARGVPVHLRLGNVGADRIRRSAPHASGDLVLAAGHGSRCGCVDSDCDCAVGGLLLGFPVSPRSV